jgi:predicted DNA-binding transcriptional regulator AlpA
MSTLGACPSPDTVGSAPILSLRQVSLLTGVAENTITRWISLGQFPKPVRNAARYPKWSYDHVMDHLRARRAQEAGHAS